MIQNITKIITESFSYFAKSSGMTLKVKSLKHRRTKQPNGDSKNEFKINNKNLFLLVVVSPIIVQELDFEVLRVQGLFQHRLLGCRRRNVFRNPETKQ